MASTEAGKWLEGALSNLSQSKDSNLQLDNDVIASLVSYCELAQPEDAREYLTNIVGLDTSEAIITEYLQRRSSRRNLNINMIPKEDMKTYMKPSKESIYMSSANKKTRGNEKASVIEDKTSSSVKEAKGGAKGKTPFSKKKKGSKVISLEEAANGSVVLKQGQPCDCQARIHKLVANCLSCGKIICEKTGEGPCSFCGALVLREGSSYAGLDNIMFPLSDGEAKAEAFKNRLVDYDRNAAARTTVIDDQSDYYEIEGNAWISEEEKMLLKKRQEEIEDAERAQRNKLVVTFDLVGRKVVMTEQEAMEKESSPSILHSPFDSENKSNKRIFANPSVSVQPVFIETQSSRGSSQKNNKSSTRFQTGICLQDTGRVQHDDPLVEIVSGACNLSFEESIDSSWTQPKVQMHHHKYEDEYGEC